MQNERCVLYLEAWILHPHGLEGGQRTWGQRQVGERYFSGGQGLLISQGGKKHLPVVKVSSLTSF